VETNQLEHRISAIKADLSMFTPLALYTKKTTELDAHFLRVFQNKAERVWVAEELLGINEALRKASVKVDDWKEKVSGKLSDILTEMSEFRLSLDSKTSKEESGRIISIIPKLCLSEDVLAMEQRILPQIEEHKKILTQFELDMRDTERHFVRLEEHLNSKADVYDIMQLRKRHESSVDKVL